MTTLLLRTCRSPFDTSAFDQLVVRHQAAVYRAALTALRVPEDAEDAAQEAFVRAWSTLSRFRGEASFKTWLLTIVWNRAINRRRMRVELTATVLK